MDGQSFDRLARLLGGAASRRAGIKAAVIAAVGLATRGVLPDESAAAKPGPDGPCEDRSGKMNRCKVDSECCTKFCKTGKPGKPGRCRCIHRGKPCRPDQKCCHGTCTNGICPRKKSRCVNPGGSCKTKKRTTKKGKKKKIKRTCCTGNCMKGKCPVQTGKACTSADVCSDAKATCTTYMDGTGGASGTYCLLPAAAACTVAEECSGYTCFSGACLDKPCGVTGTFDCANPTVTSGGSVQAAIGTGADPQLITIAPGTYSEDILIPAGVKVTLWGCPSGGSEVILKNATYGKRTIDATAGASVAIWDVVVSGYNDADGSNTNYGGGIHAVGSLNLCSTTRVEDSIWDTYGGGVRVGGTSGDRARFRMGEQTIVQNNRSKNKRGGGISLDDYCDGLIEDSAQVLNNRCANRGGGIVARARATLAIKDSAKIKDNHTGFLGGGIAVVPNPDLTAETLRLSITDNVMIDGNVTDSYTGGIMFGGRDNADNTNNGSAYDLATISGNVQVVNNVGSYGEGGIGVHSGRMVLSGSVKISKNTVTYNGNSYCGGLCANKWGGQNPSPVVVDVMDDVEISENTTDSYCGGLGVWSAIVTMSGNSSVKNNTAKGLAPAGSGRSDDFGGGGVQINTNGTLILKDNASITGNKQEGADKRGGGVVIFGGNSILTIQDNAAITGNSSVNPGGGVYGSTDPNSSPVLNNNGGTISGNTPDQCAGDVSC